MTTLFDDVVCENCHDFIECARVGADRDGVCHGFKPIGVVV